MSRMPKHYPSGGPLYWKYEGTGELARAVDAYLWHRCEPSKPAMTAGQIELLRDYLVYWINAPAWMDGGDPEAFQRLLDSAPGLSTEDEIARWLWLALSVGIDPL